MPIETKLKERIKSMRQLLATAGAVLVSLLVSTPLYAAILWADLTGTTVVGATTTVAGFLGAVPITITAPLAPNSVLTGIPGELNYFVNNPLTYTSSVVTNIPATADLVKLHNAGLVTVTFAAPVVDPVIAIVSMGGAPVVNWDFGVHPINILSSGPGPFGTGLPLSKVGSVLSGRESNGVVQILGTITSFSFTVVTAENWGGFTVGIPTAVAPPPPVPLAPIPVTLSWELPQVVKNIDGTTLVITDFHLYRGTGAACANPAPLATAVNVVIPGTATTAADTVPAVIGDVCYEITSVAISGESERSTRAIASIGRSTAFPPRNLRLRF